MEGQKKKLFLLDAFALIYRSYFAFSKNPRINSKGQNTSASFGFVTTLRDVIRNQKPSHIAVVFDPPTRLKRLDVYPEYKANREAMPEDIRSSIPYIQDIVRAFNIPVLSVDGYEADDVIGTLAKKAEQCGFITYMMTPDKDYAQLVSENIFMYKPSRSGKGPEVWGIPEVKERFGVETPEQVIDVLGMWGDSVDNIPGIPGIGEKTAKKLIAQYGSLEGLIDHSHELKGKQKENVENFADQGRLSKHLATIVLDVPIEFNEEDCKLIDINKEAIKALFTELEFRGLAKTMLGEEIDLTPQIDNKGQIDLFGTEQVVVAEQTQSKTLEEVETNYQLVQTKEEINTLIALLQKSSSYCFDTETTGLDVLTAELVGISFSVKEKSAFYVALPKEFEEAKEIVHAFSPIFEDESKEVIAHNLKYDLKMLLKYGVELKGTFFDTMIAHYLIQPDSRHNMDLLSELYLGYQPVSIETLIGKKGKNQKSMGDLSPEEICNYACEDADITLQLKQIFEPKLKENNLLDLFYQIELPLIPVLAAMEMEGINLDLDALKEQSKSIGTDIDLHQSKIIDLAGEEFNIDSPKQLGVILFDKLVITEKAKKTKTGQYSTNEDVLSKLEDKHEIIPEILSYRMLKKLKSTYVDALPELVNQKDHRLHTSYMQTVAATGRLSSNNPNLQNIPIRTERGREVRKAFIPRDKNHSLLAADYSQIELRVIAAMSGDQAMQDAFIQNIDIHASTASKVFGVGLDDVTRELRSRAKAVNFGILYGQSAFSLAAQLGIKRGEAKEIIESYFDQFSGIRTFIDNNIAKAKELGYVETIRGRRRYLKDINSSNAIVRGHAERNAVNAPIQGSAADIVKIAMINIHDAMRKEKMKSKMLLQVHDELVFDVLNEEQQELSQLVKEFMENAVKIDVPLVVEMGTASSWLDAH